MHVEPVVPQQAAHVDVVVDKIHAKRQRRYAHQEAHQPRVGRLIARCPEKQHQCGDEKDAVVVVIVSHHRRRPHPVVHERFHKEYRSQHYRHKEIQFAEMVYAFVVEMQSDVATHIKQEYEPQQRIVAAHLVAEKEIEIDYRHHSEHHKILPACQRLRNDGEGRTNATSAT